MTYIWKQGMVGLVPLRHSLVFVGQGENVDTVNLYFLASNCTLMCVARDVPMAESARSVIGKGVRCRKVGFWPTESDDATYQGYVVVTDGTACTACCTFCGYMTELKCIHPERESVTALMGHIALDDSGRIVPSDTPTALVWWERGDWVPSEESVKAALGNGTTVIGELGPKCLLYTVAN